MAARRSWVLPALVRHVTLAGLDPGPGVVWAWSDWATDESGFEMASIIEILDHLLAHACGRQRDRLPGRRGGGLRRALLRVHQHHFVGSGDAFAHVQPGGGQTLSAPLGISTFEPLAVGPGYLAICTGGGQSNTSYLNIYSSATLAKMSSSRLGSNPEGIVGTPTGVVAVNPSSVVAVNPSTGATSPPVAVAGAALLLFGSHPSVIADYQGKAYLVRLS